jgi:O-antigen/teichoic acid export membrane protein
MSSGQRLTRSIASNWLHLALNIGVSFFLSPFVVNALGGVYYGIWAVTMQFTGYLYLLDFGVRESVVRYTAKYRARQQAAKLNDVLTTAFAVYIPITLACVLLTMLCAWGVPRWFNIDAAYAGEARWAVIFTGLTIAQTFFFNVFTGVLQGLHRFDIMNATGMATTLLRTGLIVWFLQRGYGIVALAAIQLFVALLAGTINASIALSKLRSAGMRYRVTWLPRRRLMALARRIFGYGFYVLVNNVAQKINYASDAIVVGLFMPISAVTYYAIAGSLVEYLRSLITSTAQVFSPMSSQLHALRQHDALGKMLIKGARLTVIITLPIAVTYTLLGTEFIGLWMGDEFKDRAGEVLGVLGFTQILAAPHYVISSVLYGMSQHRSIALLRVGEATAKLTLSIVLVKSLGIMGVALGTAISHAALVLFILPVMICRRLALSLWTYFIGVYRGPLLAVMPFVAGAWLASKHLPAGNLLLFFLQVGALSALYVPCVYLLALERDEQAMVRNALAKLRPRASAD